MKRKYNYLALGGILFMLQACGGEGNTEDTNTDAAIDSTEVTQEIDETEEVPAELTYDGVEKGDYMLYGYSDMNDTERSYTTEEMMASINETGTFDGQVKVEIDEVCKKAGCWITFNNGSEDPIRVFFKDHFTIPTETASGTEAILMGKAVVDTMTVDFQKHLLDDAAEAGDQVAQSEYDAITEDKIETTFDCEAILVKKG